MQELQRMQPALLQQIRMLDWLGMSVHFARSVPKLPLPPETAALDLW